LQHEERKAGRLGVDAISPVVQKVAPGTKFLSKHPLDILEAGEQLDIPLMVIKNSHSINTYADHKRSHLNYTQ